MDKTNMAVLLLSHNAEYTALNLTNKFISIFLIVKLEKIDCILIYFNGFYFYKNLFTLINE